MNGIGGWTRLWLGLSALWLILSTAMCATMGDTFIEAPLMSLVGIFGPPIGLYGLGQFVKWVFDGFQGR